MPTFSETFSVHRIVLQHLLVALFSLQFSLVALFLGDLQQWLMRELPL